MQKEVLDKNINQALEKILEAVRALEKKEKIAELQENREALTSYWADYPIVEMLHESHETMQDILREMLKIHTHREMRHELSQTTLITELNQLLTLFREVLERIPQLTEFLAEPMASDEMLTPFREAIAAWNIESLPLDLEVLTTARHYYDTLNERAEQLRKMADEAINSCEKLLITIQEAQEKNPSAVEVEPLEDFLQASLMMYATHTAAILAEVEATMARVTLDEVADKILASPERH